MYYKATNVTGVERPHVCSVILSKPTFRVSKLRSRFFQVSTAQISRSGAVIPACLPFPFGVFGFGLSLLLSLFVSGLLLLTCSLLCVPCRHFISAWGSRRRHGGNAGSFLQELCCGDTVPLFFFLFLFWKTGLPIYADLLIWISHAHSPRYI